MIDGFERLEKQIEETFDLGSGYEEVINLCEILLKIDPTHLTAHYYLGKSLSKIKSKDYSKRLFHFQKYLDASVNHDDECLRRRDALDCTTVALYYLQAYDEAIVILRDLLKYDDGNHMNDSESVTLTPAFKIRILWNLVVCYKAKKDVAGIKRWNLELIEYCLEKFLDDDVFGYYLRFDRAYKSCYPEEGKKIEKVMGDKDAFVFPLIDAYENWNTLTRMHQKQVERTQPDRYKNLCTFSSLMKSFLHNMKIEFTDMTMDIIHSFLFLV